MLPVKFPIDADLSPSNQIVDWYVWVCVGAWDNPTSTRGVRDFVFLFTSSTFSPVAMVEL